MRLPPCILIIVITGRPHVTQYATPLSRVSIAATMPLIAAILSDLVMAHIVMAYVVMAYIDRPT